MPSVRHRKRLYKQMALEVAVRNPERYYSFLVTYSKFEGTVLDDEGILDIYAQLFLDEVITASDVDISVMSETDIKEFVKKNCSHNNEWGFPTGYQAAFTRYLKTLSEFGFIYSQYNQEFHISPVGKAVVKGKITLSEAFALQSMRFWRKSPYRRVLNDFNYFDYVLKLIEEREQAGHKLSIVQFYVSLFSDDGNVENSFKTFDDNNFGADEDAAFNYVFNAYSEADENHARVATQNTSFRDYGNTVFRVLQLTGFITVDHSGLMCFTINKNRLDFWQALRNQHFSISEEAKESERIYFEELGSFSDSLEKLIVAYREKEDLSTTEYNKKIPNLLEVYNLNKESVIEYLRDIDRGVKNDRKCFWFIQAPVKYELLLTLLLYCCYGNTFEYKPNFKCDDAGVPYSHAPGNIGDIEIMNQSVYWLVEATLIKNKQQQMNNETVNLFRHIWGNKNCETYVALVAPYIHDDTELIIKVATTITMIEHEERIIYSKPETTSAFIESAKSGHSLDSIKGYTIDYVKRLKDFLNNIDIT